MDRMIVRIRIHKLRGLQGDMARQNVMYTKSSQKSLEVQGHFNFFFIKLLILVFIKIFFLNSNPLFYAAYRFSIF